MVENLSERDICQGISTAWRTVKREKGGVGEEQGMEEGGMGREAGRLGLMTHPQQSPSFSYIPAPKEPSKIMLPAKTSMVCHSQTIIGSVIVPLIVGSFSHCLV